MDGHQRDDALASKRILIADDATESQRLLSFILGRAGATVEVVSDGYLVVEAARAAAESGQGFHLIVLDMDMPGLNGYGAAKMLRRSGLQTPILAVTGFDEERDAEICRSAGCTAYLKKPIDPAALRQTCIGLVSGPQSAAA